MAKLTVAAAVKAGYAPKASIYKYIKSGKVSAETDAKDIRRIDESELRRVYGDPTPKSEALVKKQLKTSEFEKELAANKSDRL